ncbi:hypothetical protein [Agrococcus sp. SGAir0287]|uniref:hypothetical protein n=1 Tax=Agrococcus sp. SGAir0287 TaxID=2070347 RepID=UPI0010F53E9F|nr:hypothetical protein [Agrococcus sp. SGAir0287]
MIDLGTLPEPQWMTLGRRIERVYSQEWVLLALDQLAERRLPGFERLRSPFVPPGVTQFVVRFDSGAWTLEELVSTLTATQRLWHLCNDAVGVPDADREPIVVQRLQAGSPLDLLIAVSNAAGLSTPPAAVALLIWILKNPDKVSGILPNFIAGWHEGWARVHKGKLERLQAKVDFDDEVRSIRADMKSTPIATEFAERDEESLALEPPPKKPKITGHELDAPASDPELGP